MTRLDHCPREADVVAAVTSGRWPSAVDGALQEHVASCPVCADVLAVAGAMAPLEREALDGARLPSAGQVWLRTQVRARHEAARAAALPVLAAQGLAAAVVLGMIAALVSWQWPAIATATETWVRPLAALDLGITAWLGVATAFVLAPLAIYAAVRE